MRPSLIISLLFLTGVVSGTATGTQAQSIAQGARPLVSLEILSARTLSGTAGDYVTVRAQITNTGNDALTDVTTFLALLDTGNKLPVDLEDWSAEKGLYIGTIEGHQTLPLEWKIHFVKAGTYALTIVAETPKYEIPQASRIITFRVDPKRNLDPRQVLPVALGTPLAIILVLSLLSYRRRASR